MHKAHSRDRFFSMCDICQRTLHICTRVRIPRYVSLIRKAAVQLTIGGIPLLYGGLCSSKITIVDVIINMCYAEDAFDFQGLYGRQENMLGICGTSFREFYHSSIHEGSFYFTHKYFDTKKD